MSEHLTDGDLAALIDGELDGAAALLRHLEHCPACDARRVRLAGVSEAIATVLRDSDPDVPAAKGRLGTLMARDAERLRARPLLFALVAALLFLTVRYDSTLFSDSLIARRGVWPRASLTPGAARPIALDEICAVRPREAATVPPALRAAVLRDYGMEDVPADQYELDYLITPELGGLTDRRNLWPEPYGLRAWNAHAKDALEHTLPRLVCSGALDVETAQREIARNWVAAYKKYLALDRPVTLHARLVLPTAPKPEW